MIDLPEILGGGVATVAASAAFARWVAQEALARAREAVATAEQTSDRINDLDVRFARVEGTVERGADDIRGLKGAVESMRATVEGIGRNVAVLVSRGGREGREV